MEVRDHAANEARNIKEGVKIYAIKGNPEHSSHAIGSNVTSMKLADDLVPPQKNILVGTVGSGDTIDHTIKKTMKQLSTEVRDIFKTDPSTGKIIIVKDNENKPVPIPKEDFSLTSLTSGTSIIKAVTENLKSQEQKLLEAAQVWFSEGFLGNGKFHGDFHSGNIMTTNEDATFIDFGNLYEFKKDYAKDKDGNVITEPVQVKDKDGKVIGTEQKPKVIFDERIEMLRLILGCVLRNGGAFVNGFKNLLSQDGKKVFQGIEDKAEAIVNSIMAKGDIAHDVATRLQCILSELQKLGMEVPPQIYCFVQSMNRLQNTIDEMNNTIMLGKLLVDTVQNGDISGNKEPPVRDELDVMGKFTDYFRSGEGRKIVHVNEHYFDDDADLADKDKAHIKNFFLENGMPKYLIELNAKYLNRSDYNPGGPYFEKVLNRINTAHDPLKEATELFQKYLIDILPPDHETAVDRKKMVNKWTDDYNRAKEKKDETECQRVLAKGC